MTTDIAAKTTSTRTINNTEFSVQTVAQRQQYGRRVEWVLVRGLCNGTADGSTTYRTRRELMAAFKAC